MEANNVKAMRDALEELVANIEMRSSTFGLNVMVDTKTFLDAKAALATPPRNCDIYTDIDSAFRACQEDRGYLKSPVDERRSVISFMLSTNTSGEANKDEGEPDESK